jgi:signal transduction histidine kinase
MRFHEMLLRQRQQLLDQWSRQVEADLPSRALDRAELVDHMPLFLDEMTAELCPEPSTLPAPGRGSAASHGEQRLRLGFNVGEVVHEYGVLHTTILRVAEELGVCVTVADHTAIVGCINGGMQIALSEYVAQRDRELQRQASEHLGFVAHELRGPLSGARIACDLLREEMDGSRLVEMLDRSLKRSAWLVDSALTQAWLKLGIEPRLEPIDVRGLLGELQLEASLEAERKGVEIAIDVARDLRVNADPRLLRSAVSNILRNAIKFTQPKTTVAMRSMLREGRFTVEVEDECGGLPPGKAEELFSPTVQRGQDRTGFGLGLAIARQAVAAHDGIITIRDVPQRGCVFAIELPAPAVPTSAARRA